MALVRFNASTSTPCQPDAMNCFTTEAMKVLGRFGSARK
jgi:hypothetical protein